MQEAPKHYWEVGPNPTNPLNTAVRMAFEPWNYAWIKATKSHGWEWARMDYPEDYQGILLSGDPEASQIKTGLITFPSLIAAEGNWKYGWQHIRALQPDHERIDLERDLQWWRYGWSPAWEGKDKAFLDYCKIKVYPSNTITAFESSRPFRVHGIGSDGAEVPLIVSERLHRNDPKYSHLVRF